MKPLRLISFFLPVLMLIYAAVSSPAYANKAQALEIEADNSLEWDRNNKTFMAKGNAVASNGDARVYADALIAHYTENESGDIIIKKIVASGNARTEKSDDVITAREMVAFMNAQNRLDRIEASKNVKITTPNEKATSDKAVYSFSTEIASMNGNVKLTRGANVMLGQKAEFNLKTNVARLFSAKKENGAAGSGRVRGVFYVDADKADVQFEQDAAVEDTQSQAEQQPKKPYTGLNN